jgi:hypothetical protein
MQHKKVPFFVQIFTNDYASWIRRQHQPEHTEDLSCTEATQAGLWRSK